MNRKDTLPEFVGEAIEVEQGSLPGDPRELESVLVALAVSVGVEAPPETLKARLIAAATTGPTRYAPLFDDLARLFDLGVDAVVRLLERADSESEWEPGPHPSIRLFHLQPGPSLASADAGFVRMPAGFEWPGHRHSAAEKVLILEGGYRDNGGHLYRAGDIHEMAAATEHSFVVLPDTPLVFAVVLHGPIEML